MSLFSSTLNQLLFLFSLIAVGFLLAKLRIIPENSATVLAKLETTLFVPGLIIGTFVEHFTVDKLSYARTLLLYSSIIMLTATLLAILIPKTVTKDKYIQKIYTYGLTFSNFGFMGNAVVSALFPDIFLDYLLFTLPLWFLIYLWGVPSLLIAKTDGKVTVQERFKNLCNPMFIAMIIGIILGLSQLSLPSFLLDVINVSGSCMSPVAMLLTGITVSTISFKKTFTNWSIYAVSLIRLVGFPLLFIGIALVVPLDRTTYTCALCSLAMPLGLNTIVIPSGYGRDTSVAAGMAVISHLLSCITIPLMFLFIP